jgi:hypothetical protein
VTLLRDWDWHSGLRKWFLSCRLTAEVDPNPFVPAKTDWFVIVSPSYPWGTIKFHPAKVGGLAHTFQHQSYEKETSCFEVPWRRSSLCLDTPTKSLGRQEYSVEPYEARLRLAWHCRRALAWLIDASRGELVQSGEPFELPQYPINQSSDLSVAFSEDPKSYAIWQTTAESYGLVEFYVLKRRLSVQVVKCFKRLDTKTVLDVKWGPSVTQEASTISRGFWFRVPGIPVQSPWQAPITWSDLREAYRSSGFDLDRHFREALESVRTDQMGGVVLFGFPICERVGKPPERMHWLGISVPNLLASDAQVPGFRKSNLSSWIHNRNRVLTDSAPIRWLQSENWYPDQLQSRGRLAKEMISKRILLLGAGALGSTFAELLARAGVQSMLLMDDDYLEAGNLVRHTLTLRDLNEHKAEAVANRINGIGPTIHAEFLNLSFPPSNLGTDARIRECEIVIDCTGSDEVLHELAEFIWRGPRVFASLSFSLAAKKLFCFAARADRFPHTAYRNLINPWLVQDRDDHRGQELPREGVGCWHPVFPARADDVWLLASTALKWLEHTVLSPLSEPQLVIFEQTFSAAGDFLGVSALNNN